jgi:hypothetical protein
VPDFDFGFLSVMHCVNRTTKGCSIGTIIVAVGGGIVLEFLFAAVKSI